MSPKDNKPEEKLKRRTVLKGIASLWATNSMPTAKLLPILEQATGRWPLDLIKALPYVDLLRQDGLLRRFNTIADVGNGNIKEAHLTFEEAFGKMEKGLSAKNLEVAWEGNLRVSAERLAAYKKIQSALDSKIDVNLQLFFSMLEQEDNRNKLAHILFERETGSLFDPAKFAGDSSREILMRHHFSYDEHILERILKLKERYPTLNHTISIRNLLSAMRQDIAEALRLPLENGCLNRSVSMNGTNEFQYLLKEVPELFPKDKLSTFQRLVEDLEKNGRQTVKLEDMRLHTHGKNLDYRQGYTDVQAQGWVENLEKERQFPIRKALG